MLLLDDVQFFNGKNRTQEEFSFALNALIDSNKQIVISCDTCPKDISGLEDRLVGCFGQGLTVQIARPKTEMRVSILKKKAEAEGVELDDEVVLYIAKHIGSNIRELEGALKKIQAYTNIYGQFPDLKLVKMALKS